MLRLNRNFVLVLCLACLALGSISWPAAAGDGQWHLRAQAVWVHPDLDWQTSPEPGNVVMIDGDDAFGLSVSGEYQVSDLLGVDLAIMRAVPDVNIRVEDAFLGASLSASEGLTMTPLSLGLSFHLTPRQRFDLYIGPYLAYVLYSDLEWRLNETIVVDGVPIVIDETLRTSVANDLAYGAVVGADVPLGSGGWYFSSALKYLATELEVTDPEGERETLSLDPFIVTLGVRYSF